MTEHAQPDPASSADDGIDPKVGGLVAYLTWIGGLIMLLTQRHPEVRFHGAQSILVTIAFTVVYLALGILQLLAGLILWWLGALFSVLYLVIGLGALALWILLAVKGYQLVHFKLPLVGDIAEKWAARR